MQPVSMLLLLLLLLLPVTTDAAQQLDGDQSSASRRRQYYCSRSDETVVLSDSGGQFDLVTRYSDTDHVSSYMNCSFQTVAMQLTHGRRHGNRYYIEIASADVANDASFLEVLDVGVDVKQAPVQLLHEVNLHWTRQVMVSHSNIIRVTFATWNYPLRHTGSSNNNTGYTIRLHLFATCPMNWSPLGRNHCFSQTSASFLGGRVAIGGHAKTDFASAQLVCNRMRANLLVASQPLLDSIDGVSHFGQLTRKLQLNVSVWIGLTSDVVGGDGAKLYWLDGTPTDL